MLKLENDSLKFSFENLHPNAQLTINFQRTLRIPDDGKSYPLPPGFSTFPVRHIDDYKENVPSDWMKKGGVLLPMYQSEALWIKFANSWAQYPFAVKVSAGKRSAITGEAWKKGLKKDDYVVCPKQPWIDGFAVKKGQIRQFVAEPLGSGFTVEEQLTGKAEFGGIQIEVFPMKRSVFDKRFPPRTIRPQSFLRSAGMAYTSSSSFSAGPKLCSASASRSRKVGYDPRGEVQTIGEVALNSMGMAAGGLMNQEIFQDPYDINDWDLENKSRVFVHLLNSMTWRQITGQDPPSTPITAAEYERRGYPWYAYYDEGPALQGSKKLASVKSVAQMEIEKGVKVIDDGHKIKVGRKIKVHGQVREGKWT